MRFIVVCSLHAVLALLTASEVVIAASAETNLQRIPFPDARLQVFGLPGFTPEKGAALRRLPERLKETFRPPVWSLAQDPSGGRIRFATDSRIIGIVAENPAFSN